MRFCVCRSRFVHVLNCKSIRTIALVRKGDGKGEGALYHFPIFRRKEGVERRTTCGGLDFQWRSKTGEGIVPRSSVGILGSHYTFCHSTTPKRFVSSVSNGSDHPPPPPPPPPPPSFSSSSSSGSVRNDAPTSTTATASSSSSSFVRYTFQEWEKAVLVPIARQRDERDIASPQANDIVDAPSPSSKCRSTLFSSSFLSPPASVYVFGKHIGPRPLVILDRSQPVTDVVKRNDTEGEKEPVGMRKYEPLLRQLQWEHGAIYVPLPVPSSFILSSPGVDGVSLEANGLEGDKVNAVEVEATMDLIGASCERVRMVLDMFDIRWTHFLTYSYGALVAARMAASPISPSSTSFPLCPFASESYAHRVGTILLLDTPLVTSAFVDNFHRRRELYLAALDVNIPLSDLKSAKKTICAHLEDPLPTPCVADKALYEQYLFEPSFTFPAASSSSLSSLRSGTKEVEGMKVLVEETQEESEDNDGEEEEVQAVHRQNPMGKGETKGVAHPTTARCPRGLFRCDQRYIPMAHLVKDFGHPMELITPAEDAVAEVEIFKKMFGLTRRTAVIKSAKRWPQSARPSRPEKKSDANGAAAASASQQAAGKTIMKKDGESAVVPFDSAQRPIRNESLLFERMQHESEMNTNSCSPLTSGTDPKRNTSSSSSSSEEVLHEKATEAILPSPPRNTGDRTDPTKGSPGTPSPTFPESSSKGGSVTAEVCHVIRTWIHRYEPDVYISQQFTQRMGEMKQLVDAGDSSTGGDLVKKTKEPTKEKKKKEKKKK